MVQFTQSGLALTPHPAMLSPLAPATPQGQWWQQESGLADLGLF